MIRRAVRAALEAAGIEIRRRPTAPPAPSGLSDQPDWVNGIYRTVRPYTMVNQAGTAVLCNAIEHVWRAHIEGAIVECGVWKGGSMMAAALALLQLDAPQRHLWLYDTYEGMSDPTDRDVVFETGQTANSVLDQLAPKYPARGAISLAEVRANMAIKGYPADVVHYIKGKVEDTIPAQIPDSIALLRLDTDWYESTKHELEHLWPRLVPGGICILDDYGYWEGARLAIDEFFAKDPVFLARVSHEMRVVVKPR